MEDKHEEPSFSLRLWLFHKHYQLNIFKGNQIVGSAAIKFGTYSENDVKNILSGWCHLF